MRRGALLVVLAATAVVHAANTDAVYTGAAACAKCHAEIHARRSQSRHSKMVRPATKASVKGDFTRGNLQLRARDGVYYITVSTLTGKSQEHPGDYTRTTARALTNLEASLRIDPATPARYFLAAAYVQQGQVAKAKKYC